VGVIVEESVQVYVGVGESVEDKVHV
jgi:hypothetical protein